MTWRYRVGVAGPLHAAEITLLRQAAYARAPEFQWHDPAALAWSVADEQATVIVVIDEQDRIVSSMRAAVMASVAQAEATLEYALAGLDLPLPTLALSRAATAPEFATRGFFALIRYAYLCALPHTPINSVVAVVYEGGPRLSAMSEAGYEMFEPLKSWDSEATARSRPLVAVLPRARFETAQANVADALVHELHGVFIDATAIAKSLTCAVAVRE